MKKTSRILVYSCLCSCLLLWPVWLWRDSLLTHVSPRTSSAGTPSAHVLVTPRQSHNPGDLKSVASSSNVLPKHASGGQVEVVSTTTFSVLPVLPVLPAATSLATAGFGGGGGGTGAAVGVGGNNTGVAGSFGGGSVGGGSVGGGSVGSGGSGGGRDFNDETCPLTDPRP
ncbi:MAG: hypothetical protein WCO79_03360 [bacterium]